MTAGPAGEGFVRRRATGREHPAVVALARGIGKLLFRVIFRLRLRGREHVPAEGAVIYAGNHSGFLDGPLVFALAPRPAAFLTKAEMFVGGLARCLGWLGQIPVHRGRPDRQALRAGLAVLTAGRALGVFPEGTRGSGALDQVQQGIAFLALHAGCPVVPVAVVGTAEALPKGAKVPRWRAPVDVAFGEPFVVRVHRDPRTRTAKQEAAEQVRRQLRAHLDTVQAEQRR